MEILLIALLALLGLIVATRFIGRGQEKALGQYEALEKRFRLDRETFRSKWGKGIGERYTLRGEYRGYALSLYYHYHDSERGKRQDWTSLVFEVLFAENFAFDIVFANSQPQALFPSRVLQHRLEMEEGAAFLLNRDGRAGTLITEGIREPFHRFSEMKTCGAVRLNNGFLEYRETGLMTSDEMRQRFQEAILLLGDLADAISIFMVQAKREG